MCFSWFMRPCLNFWKHYKVGEWIMPLKVHGFCIFWLFFAFMCLMAFYCMGSYKWNMRTSLQTIQSGWVDDAFGSPCLISAHTYLYMHGIRSNCAYTSHKDWKKKVWPKRYIWYLTLNLTEPIHPLVVK